MHLFKDTIERGVRVGILIPAERNDIIEIVNEVNLVLPQLDIGRVDKSLESTVGILVVDRKESLIIETKDDSKDNSYDAAGLAAYSNSKLIASAYASIFEGLWKQTELQQKLNKMYEKLKTHDRMQKEFIDIAAHELRTPIQPILGLTGDLIRSNNGKDKRSTAAQGELLGVIMRNAMKLQRLADDILDVTKIESKSLNLNKEFFNLNDVITSTLTVEFHCSLSVNLGSISATPLPTNFGFVSAIFSETFLPRSTFSLSTIFTISLHRTYIQIQDKTIETFVLPPSFIIRPLLFYPLALRILLTLF